MKKLLLAVAILCACGFGVRGAEIAWDGTYSITDDGNTYFVAGSVSLGAGRTNNGILEIRSGGTLTTNGQTFENNKNITIQTGGTLTAAGNLRNANAASSTATINISGGTLNITAGLNYNANGASSSGTINVTSGTFNITNGIAFYNAKGASSTGTINVTNGTFNITDTVIFNGDASGATGTIDLSGGIINLSLSGQYFYNGRTAGATCIINISGGVFNYTGIGAGTFFNGVVAGATATMNISGGTVNQNGRLDNGRFNSTGTGTINITGGTYNIIANYIFNSGGNSTTGNINLSSGALNVYGSLSNAHRGSGNFTMTGGTLSFKSGGEFWSGNLGTGTLIAYGGTIEFLSNSAIYDAFSGGTSNITISASTQFKLGNVAFSKGGGTTNVTIFGQHYTTAYIVDSALLVNDTMTIPADSKFFLEQGAGLTVNSGGILNLASGAELEIQGTLKNKSSSSVNVYGTVYTYSYIENGDGSNPGTINVNHGGDLYLLSAEMRNAHAGSAINVNTGGRLHNYQGIVDVNIGDLNLNDGGTFNNVRGNYPATLTAASGGNFFDGDVMMLDRDLTLEYTWTITEKAKLFGNGNKITFGTDGGILIQGADASLLLEDVLIENISGNQIRCTEDTTTLSVDNVVWLQKDGPLPDANYSFTKGTLNVNGDWLVKGANTTFAYSSNQASTLQQDTNWIFDTDVTFSYDSSAAGNIVLADATAQIHFDGATLHVSQDARFKDGAFVFDDIVTLNTETGKTLYFGNNNASENLTLDFHNLSKTKIAGSGTLTNQNV